MAKTLDDYAVGTVERFGSYRITRDEVIDFASRYDPHPIHLDDHAAAANPLFGRLTASGWHTIAATIRMFADHIRQTDFPGMGSPGVEDLRWLVPVYPGDTLRVENEILESRASRSRPEIGFLKVRLSTYNQHDELVMTVVTTCILPTGK